MDLLRYTAKLRQPLVTWNGIASLEEEMMMVKEKCCELLSIVGWWRYGVRIFGCLGQEVWIWYGICRWTSVISIITARLCNAYS